ncbi:MAG: hypothetical protein JSW61_07745 [Candidatus Thorarchaeota archaeon]|nr:MAG: hypothetical protein JSW61_07745 [Candidatus Thorarchaeota archaeon]
MAGDLKAKVLKLLALEFEYTQALHSETEDIASKLGEDEDSIVETLQDLEREGLVSIWIDHRGKVKLAKITWRGLNEYGSVDLRYGLDRSNI